MYSNNNKPIEVVSLNGNELNTNMLSNMSELFGALTTIPSKDIDLNSYIATIIGSIDKKIDFGNDLSLQS